MQIVEVSKISRSLKALCDANRIRILEILASGEHCVSDLVTRLEIDQPKVSHHLAILRSAGIVRSRRDGRHINYSLRREVHRQAESPQGPMDLFDLGEITVAFRFGRPAGQARGPHLAAVEHHTQNGAASHGAAAAAF